METFEFIAPKQAFTWFYSRASITPFGIVDDYFSPGNFLPPPKAAYMFISAT